MNIQKLRGGGRAPCPPLGTCLEYECEYRHLLHKHHNRPMVVPRSINDKCPCL